MSHYLPLAMKQELQQRYRRFLECFKHGEEAQKALLRAKASRIWLLGVIAMLFALGSEFYLGVAAAFIGTYCYQVVAAYIKKAQVEDNLEEMQRWFHAQDLNLLDGTPFYRDDEQLENPIDLFADSVYQ